VTAPGGWGPVVNGGAWLSVEGQRVDLCYRDLDEVLTCVAETEQGRFDIHALAGFVGGIPSYVVVGELTIGRQLVGSLPPPAFPAALAASAPSRWRQLSKMAVRTARAHASRDDVTLTVANLTVAAVSEAQARLAERSEWALNEKGIVDRAGLGACHGVLANPGCRAAELAAAVASVAAIVGVVD
jgi:hypothetical protein